MDKVSISVFVPRGTVSQNELDKLIRYPISDFESYGAFMRPADHGFIRVIGGDVFNNRLNAIIRFIRDTLPGKKIWFQCEGSGSISIAYFDGDELLYSMEGTIVRGRTEIDQYREQYPELDKACQERKSDTVVFKCQDDHLFVRQFWNDKTILMIDGYINEDNRSEKVPVILMEPGSEISGNTNGNE